MPRRAQSSPSSGCRRCEPVRSTSRLPESIGPTDPTDDPARETVEWPVVSEVAADGLEDREDLPGVPDPFASIVAGADALSRSEPRFSPSDSITVESPVVSETEGDDDLVGVTKSPEDSGPRPVLDASPESDSVLPEFDPPPENPYGIGVLGRLVIAATLALLVFLVARTSATSTNSSDSPRARRWRSACRRRRLLRTRSRGATRRRKRRPDPTVPLRAAKPTLGSRLDSRRALERSRHRAPVPRRRRTRNRFRTGDGRRREGRRTWACLAVDSGCSATCRAPIRSSRTPRGSTFFPSTTPWSSGRSGGSWWSRRADDRRALRKAVAGSFRARGDRFEPRQRGVGPRRSSDAARYTQRPLPAGAARQDRSDR